MRSPHIYFYIPKPYFPQKLPSSARENWQGFGLGIYVWTLQTYLHLQTKGFPCQLVNHLPAEGIVLFHRNALQAHQKPIEPKANRLAICIKAEERRYPYAQLHIVQNPEEAKLHRDSYYLPHWTQPGLIPRNRERGDRFKNIAYFGHIANLAPELQDSSWEEYLTSIGLRWLPVINANSWNNQSQIDTRWNDYSQIDAIVSVRRFERGATYGNKPATKLYNAWLAGVPAVLGAESAYRTEGENGVNYLEVTSQNKLISALEKLKSDRTFRQNLVLNGSCRGQDYLPEKTTQKWIHFLEQTAIPAFFNWRESPSYLRIATIERNKLTYRIERAKSKLKSLLLTH